MKTIHKRVLEVKDRQTLSFPKGAEFLHIDLQGNDLCLWYSFTYSGSKDQVDTEWRAIAIIGTGQEFGELQNWTYLGTVLPTPFVWHIYEITG